MDSIAALTIVVVLLLWAWFHVLPRRGSKLPPGPYPFPIIGNILQLGSNPHRSLATLSKTYGPLMTLQLGTRLTVVVSSPETAKKVLQQHDQVFCGRTIMAAAEAHDLHLNSMGLLPAVDTKCKKQRKVCREHLFSKHGLDESQHLRTEKLMKLRDYVGKCCDEGGAVDIGKAVFITIINLITATFLSVDVTSFGSKAAQGLKETVEGVQRNLGTPNLADFFPVLKAMDPQGIKNRTGFYLGKLLGMFEDIISQRLKSRDEASENKYYDFLETLLHLREDESGYNLNIHDIKYLFTDLLIGGTFPTTSSAEWAMTELLKHPEKMEKAKNEVRSVIGKNKQVEESDISRLPYLQAVITETLRLHPPAPFLVPRKADYEIEIHGYTIPKDAQIFVNVWGIQRDSRVWPNPNSFEPERFFNRNVDYKGKDFAIIPFGSGRRICPGLALGDRMLLLIVASLVHEFDWKLELKPEDVDTNDKFGIAVRKEIPLVAIPTKVF